jgi:hypothetical protein
MKLLFPSAAAVLSLLMSVFPVCAQQTTTKKVTTTTTAPADVSEQKTTKVVQPSQISGNIASVDAAQSTLLLSVRGNASPLRFFFGDNTAFVDASGDPMTQDAMKLGQGVTLDYVQAGDRLVITRARLQPAGAVTTVQPATTTQTTTVKPAPVVPTAPAAPAIQQQTTTTTTTTE